MSWKFIAKVEKTAASPKTSGQDYGQRRTARFAGSGAVCPRIQPDPGDAGHLLCVSSRQLRRLGCDPILGTGGYRCFVGAALEVVERIWR